MRRRGLTLIETMAVVVVILGIAGLAIPMLGNDAGSRLAAASLMLRDDLEQARYRTISNPADPVALVVDADGFGWSLVHDGDGTTPIIRGDGEAWTVRFDDPRATDLAGIRVVTDIADRSIRFDVRGVLVNDDKPSMRLELGDDHRRLDIGVVSGLIAIRRD
jgi:prepilin-type N-terminal cleavage/methylation domain-containing protein